ncbi:MAG: hypothetical protein HQL97_01145 [Magnetococcales bacterium]|nr:hypothetical protein [Magnetococcales bacterium]
MSICHEIDCCAALFFLIVCAYGFYKMLKLLRRDDPGRFCVTCRFSVIDGSAKWYTVRCANMRVAAGNPEALATRIGGDPFGIDAMSERQRTWPLAPCGIKGKLWKPK